MLNLLLKALHLIFFFLRRGHKLPQAETLAPLMVSAINENPAQLVSSTISVQMLTNQDQTTVSHKSVVHVCGML